MRKVHYSALFVVEVVVGEIRINWEVRGRDTEKRDKGLQRREAGDTEKGQSKTAVGSRQNVRNRQTANPGCYP
jgi:hypothetical protein